MAEDPTRDARRIVAAENMAADRDFPVGTPVRKRYLICSTARSGSNLLCDLLENTGVAGSPMEYLDLNHMDAWCRRRAAPGLEIEAYLADLEHTRTSPNGVFAIKAHAPQVKRCFRDPQAFLKRFDALIYLRREDKLGQAISLYRAGLTGMWTSRHEAVDTGEKPSAEFDPYSITVALKTTLDDDRDWSRMFADGGVPVIAIRYEALAERPAAVLERIFERLDIAERPSSWPEPSLRKQRDETTDSLRQAYINWLKRA